MAERPLPSPLPADLPENWALDQIVAPDGTSVGLTQQHGYNYLMEQVNAAHRGVNAINESFDTISGKRTCRFVVGTSTAGWTEADCDYLCDGVDDQAEIQAAIDAVPSGGGEIVLLAGKYQITGPVTITARRTLIGNGLKSTQLNIQPGAFSAENSAAITLYGELRDLELYGFSFGAEAGNYLIATEGESYIERVSFFPAASGACILGSPNSLSVVSCVFHTSLSDALLFQGREDSNSVLIFHSNRFVSQGRITVKPGTANSTASRPFISIVGNVGRGYLELSLNFIASYSVIACNDLNSLKLINSVGCLLSNNNFAGLLPNPCITLDAETKYNFVTGNQIINSNNGVQKTIQDNGQNNIIRFNSNDTGSGGGGASGVASFNGRSGAVTPQSGDYTAGMVGARPDTWTPTAADVGAVTGQGVQTIQAMTQEEYDALTQKSGTTMYIIKE